jgi:hypothetical protein
VKITNAELIKSGEKGLIEAVTSDLNWHIIEDLLRNKYHLKLRDGDIKYTSGDIIVHDNKVAYKLDFDVTVTLSVLLNRQGECFDVEVDSADAASDEPTESPEEDRTVDATAAADGDDKAEDVAADTETAGGEAGAAARAAPEPADDANAAEAPSSPAADESPTPSQIADMIASINSGE